MEFVGTSLEDIRKFPAAARREAGFQLHFVQAGQEPADWKPMKTVGPGAIELRIHKRGEWRIIYVARFSGRIYVLHAFAKKTRKTERSDIALARQRYIEVQEREKARQAGRK